MMIKKRYLAILSVAIISVLVGSLLYTTLVLAGKPEPQPSIYKDSVKIELKSSRISTETSPHINTTLPFTFNPKAQNFNITRMWISFITGGNAWHTIDFTLNGVTTISLDYFVISSDAVTSFETDPSFYETIVEGINVFTVSEIYKDSVTPTTEPIYYITLFIEYEYQAR